MEKPTACVKKLLVIRRTQHISHLRQVLYRLKQYNLTAKPEKCVWGADSLTYLGHQVGHGKISVPEARVAALRNYARPKTKHDVRAFLGTSGYYRRFIQDYATMARSLIEATKKAAPNNVLWTEEISSSFSTLCNTLSDFCTLTIPCGSDTFVLQTDASGFGIGAVLTVMRDGQELPCGFYSKLMSGAESRYSASEKECLALVRGIEHFDVHLLCYRSQGTGSPADVNGRLTRWTLTLQRFTFTVKYRPGYLHQNADGLSRQAWKDLPQDNPQAITPLNEDVQSGPPGRCQGTPSPDI